MYQNLKVLLLKHQTNYFYQCLKRKKILCCKVARRADIGRPNNHYYCCEDHFNVSIYTYS